MLSRVKSLVNRGERSHNCLFFVINRLFANLHVGQVGLQRADCSWLGPFGQMGWQLSNLPVEHWLHLLLWDPCYLDTELHAVLLDHVEGVIFLTAKLIGSQLTLPLSFIEVTLFWTVDVPVNLGTAKTFLFPCWVLAISNFLLVQFPICKWLR